MKQFRDTRFIERNPGQGPPRAATAKYDCYLSIAVRRKRDATDFQLPRDFYGVTGRPILRITFPECVIKEGCLRLAQFCEQEISFSIVQRSYILEYGLIGNRSFSDEDRFRLTSGDLPFSVWEVEHYGRGCLTVCAGIMFHGRIPFHIWGTVTGTSIVMLSWSYMFVRTVCHDLILVDNNVDRIELSSGWRIFGKWRYLSDGLASQISRSRQPIPKEHDWDVSRTAITSHSSTPRTIQNLHFFQFTGRRYVA